VGSDECERPWRVYGALVWALLPTLATLVALALIVFFGPLWLALLFALYCFAVIGSTEIWAAFGLTAWYWTFLWMAIGSLGTVMFIAGYDIDKGRFRRRRRSVGGQHRKRRP